MLVKVKQKLVCYRCGYWNGRKCRCEDEQTLFHGNAYDIIEKLNYVDFILTDPPYGINHPCNYKDRKRGNAAECTNYKNVIGDDKEFDPKFLIEKAPCILWGANYYANKMANVSGWLVWDKNRPDTLDQATCELAWSNVIKGVRRFKYTWNGMIREGTEPLMHPTQKPLALFEWCLTLKWVNRLKANVILDPFLGCGTTLRVCKNLGLKGIGIELSKDYCNLTVQRLEKEFVRKDERLR